MKTCLVMLAMSSLMISFCAAEQCGEQNDGALCPDNLCCSKFGWCGSSEAYCGKDCQSQCPPPPPPPGAPGDLSSVISKSQFEEMLLHRNDPTCRAKGFYTYENFLAAAKSFPKFGTTGDDDTRKREIAAFFGQTAHETNGGWPSAPDGPYAWGYCFKEEVGAEVPDYCKPSRRWPCIPGKAYFGRGPMQLTWNYNYGQCGEALGFNLFNDPDLVANDGVITFETALWFWMTPQAPKPSCHDVIIGSWTPSDNDFGAGRLPGYGVITNIINGGLECGTGHEDSRAKNRIGFYERFCGILGVGPGNNLECSNQRPFGNGLSLDAAM